MCRVSDIFLFSQQFFGPCRVKRQGLKEGKEMLSSKRPRGSPTGETPVQLEKRSSHLRDHSRSIRASHSRRNLCREYEARLLVKLIVKEGKIRWPASTDHEFWERASQFMRENGKKKTGRL